MSRLTRLTTCLLLLACGAGGSLPPSSPPPPGGPALRLLFMGNSLTYTYDIPSQVQQMAAAAGFAVPVVTTRALPDFSLEDHWNQGLVQQDLATGHYDRLIMQQGPSTLESSGIDLTQWTQTWTAAAARAGTRAGLYVVWAPQGGDVDSGIAHYEAAADAASAAIYPVAEAWREAWRLDPTMPLYGPDGFHPSQTGAWVAALVISAVVFHQPQSAFPNLFPSVITPAREAVLRSAVATVIAQAGRS